MQRSHRSRTTLALGAVLLAGCSLLTNFDEFVGGPPLPVATEAGVTSDAGEAGVDAGAALDCGDATFCDDFERDEPLGAWEKLLISGGGALDTTTERAHSGKSSLRATLPGARGEVAGVAKSFPSISRFKARYFVFVASTDGARTFDVFQVRLQYAGREMAIGVIAGTQFLVGEQQYFTDGGFVQNLLGTYRRLTNEWFEIEVDIDIGSPTPRLTVVINGTDVVANAPLALTYGTTKGEAVAGVLFTEVGGPTTVDIDDVRIEVTP